MDKEKILQRCNAICRNTLMETLDIDFVNVGEDFLTARMPVTSKVHQPDGVLHGGASVALAESVGSAASYLFLDTDNFAIRGLEISANHTRSKKDGHVFATARFLHKGRTTQLWEIRITDEENMLISYTKAGRLSCGKSELQMKRICSFLSVN